MLVEELRQQLRRAGHDAEIVTLPFKWYPSQALLNSMIMGRMLDLTEVNGERIDLVIATKFPAYYVRHPNKIVWLFHQHRQAYDLWGTPFGDIHGWTDSEFVRGSIVENDTRFLSEARKIYTIAGNVTKRLKRFNDLEAETLYPPPSRCDDFHRKGFEDFVFYPSRIDKMKRQRVLVEAARFLRSDIRVVIAGRGSAEETAVLQDLIDRHGLRGRIELRGFISDDEKIDLYSRCLAVYYGAYDEDYGYVTLEAFFSGKPVLAHTDAGGPLEFLIDGLNGFVLPEDAGAVAAAIDALAGQRGLAQEMGDRGFEAIRARNVNWGFVLGRLLDAAGAGPVPPPAHRAAGDGLA